MQPKTQPASVAILRVLVAPEPPRTTSAVPSGTACFVHRAGIIERNYLT